MAVTAKLYAGVLDALASGAVDLGSDTLKVMLCTSSYTPNQTTHTDTTDVTNEVTGTGYTAGGATLGSVTATLSGTTLTLDAADSTWADSTITARYAVVYDDTASPKTLICYVDFGEDVTSTAGEFKITWDGDGIATWTVD